MHWESANNFGKCEWVEVSSSSTIKPEPNKFLVVSYRPSESEIQAYGESRANAGTKLRNAVSALLGIDPSRFISGVVLADEVYLPRAVKCNYPISSAYDTVVGGSFEK